MTSKQEKALLLLDVQGSMRESNITDPPNGLLHWSPIDKLTRLGYCERVDGTTIRLTDAGKRAAAMIRGGREQPEVLR